jgi:hypothetical protein
MAWEQDTDARDYNRSIFENDRDYNRSVLENDRNYNRSVYEDDRDYYRSVLENDRNYAYGIVEQTLANGQMPSAELLAAAGLTPEEAALLIAQQATNGSGPSSSKVPTYYELNGKLYEDKNGRYDLVNENNIKGSFDVDSTTLQNTKPKVNKSMTTKVKPTMTMDEANNMAIDEAKNGQTSLFSNMIQIDTKKKKKNP